MHEQEIYEKLDEIFRDVIGDDTIELKPETTAADVPGWDSVTHIGLIVSIETQLGIKIHTHEMDDLKNVHEIVQLIERKTS